MTRSGPLYWRILRLRRIRPRPAVTFLLFEGSIALGILLAFADILTWWGAATVPTAVGIMVKLNDVVATNLHLRPLAEAQLRLPRLVGGRRMGVSPVPRVTAGPRSDGLGSASSPDHSDELAVVRGVASIPPRSASHPPAAARAAQAQDGAAQVQDGGETR
jgi:hypothetical protein